jgi:hypothetical protein
MSPIGHSLAGAAVGVMVLRREMPRRRQACVLAGFIVLANLPDLSLLLPRVEAYSIGHSVFVSSALCVGAAIVLRFFRSSLPQVADWRIIGGGAVSLLSHLLLDSLYNHRAGVAVLWPLNSAPLAMPLPWLGHWPDSSSFLTWQTLRVSCAETVTFFPLLGIAMAWRYVIQKRKCRVVPGIADKNGTGPIK